MKWLLVVALFFPAPSLFANDSTCSDWFARLKIKAEERDCLAKCLTGPVDLATFDCRSKCDVFCRTSSVAPRSEPSVDFWNRRIRNDRPNRWPNPKEKSKKWSAEEKRRVTDLLEKVPDSLWVGEIEGIYRFERSKDFPNPGSHVKGLIGIYDTAFQSPEKLSRTLVHEISHAKYEWMSAAARLDYMKVAGWNPQRLRSGNTMIVPRKTGYVQHDGALDPSEDFANNLEEYLHDSARLRSDTPLVHGWIEEFFGDKFKMRK
ncbi:MAG: hypothetical protein ABL958_17085 [Bdellovibrionia bacterium]